GGLLELRRSRVDAVESLRDPAPARQRLGRRHAGPEASDLENGGGGVTAPNPEVERPGLSSESPAAPVVIICYNHWRFLGAAIESVLRQTLRDVEVVVVDAGSTDDTPAVAARYPSVRYVHQANQGMAAARNTGIRASRGRYLCFLDADDRLLPDALAIGAD